MPYHIGEKNSSGCSGYPVVSDTGKVAGCHATKSEANAQLGALYANVPDASKTDCCPDLNKQEPCWDGYVQRGMKPGDNGKMVPNCVPAEKADDLWEDDDTVVYETDSMSKADGYSPPAGARSAARRAIKFKEDGKANGAGTAVGWTRAGQLARGESLSLSTVKRMYSYFSRHEVDKKGKDWGNTANPSNGYIMWLAWGGDAGYSWSRRIVNAEKDKALFADFFAYKSDTPMNVAYNATVTDPEPANPSSHINPVAGMAKPNLMPNRKKKKKYRATKAIDTTTILKDMIVEGDFVIVSCEDETHVGIVQYVMTEGMFGIASSDYAIEASMENPAILVRTLEFEEDEGIWEESEYLIGAESKMVTKIEPLALEVEVVANGYKDCGCPTCEVLNVDCENCPVCSSMSETNSEIAAETYDPSLGKSDEELKEESQEQPKPQESFFNFRDMKPSRNTVRLGE